MNKDELAAGPPSATSRDTVASVGTGHAGPLPEASQGHDPTLKWCIPDSRSKASSASQALNAVSAPNAENVVMPKASSPPAALAEGAIKGALPEAIQGATPDTSSPRGESFEIIVADGPAGGGEAELPGTPEDVVTPPPRREMEAVTPPPRREMEVVTPPPRREMEVVTPPPKRETLAVTPPARRETQAAPPPPKREVEMVTPPPKRETQAAPPSPKREVEVVTPPPRRETQAAPPPPKRETQAAPPPPKREVEMVTPPPKCETQAAPPPPKREVEVVTPPPKRETQVAPPPSKREVEVVTPPPKRETQVAPPPSEPVTSPRPLAEARVMVAASGGASWPAAQASATTGALPEAPIRMVESGEVKDGEFEVMEAVDTPSSPLPTVPTPPPVPAISGVLAATSQIPRSEASAEAGGSVGGAKAEDLASEALPLPEALSRRPLKKRLKPWFEEVFDENYLRTLPFMTAQQTLRETAFVKEVLSPPAEGEVLDIACGYGRHAIELSQRGFRVTGLDLSLPLLIRAADEAQRRALSVNFVHADMREMAYDSQFDAAYCVLTSFGYFDEETNLRVATSICRALKPGGRFLVDTINRDYIVSDLPSRVWWEGDGCVVLEEVDFDFHTSRVLIRRSIVFGDGRQVENEISIRAYSLHELGRVLRRAGFQVLEVSGSLENKEPFLGAASRHVVLVCERPLT